MKKFTGNIVYCLFFWILDSKLCIIQGKNEIKTTGNVASNNETTETPYLYFWSNSSLTTSPITMYLYATKTALSVHWIFQYDHDDKAKEKQCGIVDWQYVSVQI